MYDTDSKEAEWICFCPRTGLLMYMETGSNTWQLLNDDFQKTYKKWAIKQAEKALLGK